MKTFPKILIDYFVLTKSSTAKPEKTGRKVWMISSDFSQIVAKCWLTVGQKAPSETSVGQKAPSEAFWPTVDQHLADFALKILFFADFHIPVFSGFFVKCFFLHARIQEFFPGGMAPTDFQNFDKKSLFSQYRGVQAIPGEGGVLRLYKDSRWGPIATFTIHRGASIVSRGVHAIPEGSKSNLPLLEGAQTIPEGVRPLP